MDEVVAMSAMSAAIADGGGEHLGKMVACPQCGTTFAAGAAAPKHAEPEAAPADVPPTVSVPAWPTPQMKLEYDETPTKRGATGDRRAEGTTPAANNEGRALLDPRWGWRALSAAAFSGP